MISGVFLFNHKGDCMVTRTYRDDIARNVVDAFKVNVIHARTGARSPVTIIDRASYFHFKRNNVYIVAVTRQNANAMLVLEFLSKFIAVLESYFGKLSEETIKEDFALVYELLDEVLDYGYPQSTDPDTLKMLITQEGVASSAEESQKITSQVTGQIGWRRDGLKYRKHEIFFDVLESVNVLISPAGATLSAHVSGVIKMKSFLSGMPECKFGINDKVVSAVANAIIPASADKKKKKAAAEASQPIAIDDLTFHQCVKLGKFDADRSISFIPPDGDFELMKYRTTQDVILPIRVSPLVQEFGNRIDLTLIVKAEFDEQFDASNIAIVVPVPSTTSGVKIDCRSGRAKFKPEKNAVVWKMLRFSGGRTAQCSIEIELLQTGDKKNWVRAPLNVSFEVPFACSGLQVKYLRVLESKLGYDDANVKKFVRYISRSGQYEIRY